MVSSLNANNIVDDSNLFTPITSDCATTAHVAAHHLADLYGMSYSTELVLYNAFLEACVLGQQ